MRFKPDWSEAQRRLTALWHGELYERPCIQVMAPQDNADLPLLPEPADDEAFWLDPAYISAKAQRTAAGCWWGGEAIPSIWLEAGWLNCLGGTPRFSRETIWFDQRMVDFSKPSAFRHDPASTWVIKYQAVLAAVASRAGWDDFFVGAPLGLPANDLLAQQMGVEAFMLALADHPDWMAEAIVQGARDLVAAMHANQAFVRERHAYWYGNAGWMPFWAPEPFNTTQSDVSCMLSPAMYERFIVPELDIVGNDHGALWYHLDGGDARQHLPRLLTLPYLRVLQYTPAPNEPPNGPAHLDLYRQVQKSGKIVHIELPVENVEPLLRELDPSLVIVLTNCANRDEGERLLEASKGWI
ncbi:MAG: hypothetical protein ACYC6L_16640 [Anaerolineae bacterium]